MRFGCVFSVPSALVLGATTVTFLGSTEHQERPTLGAALLATLDGMRVPFHAAGGGFVTMSSDGLSHPDCVCKGPLIVVLEMRLQESSAFILLAPLISNNSTNGVTKGQRGEGFAQAHKASSGLKSMISLPSGST